MGYKASCVLWLGSLGSGLGEVGLKAVFRKGKGFDLVCLAGQNKRNSPKTGKALCL